MKRFTSWLRLQAQRFICWALEPTLLRLGEDIAHARHLAKAAQMTANIADAHVGNLKSQLTALQALDVNFKEHGKLVLIARVDKRDIVQIIDLPVLTLEEYRRTVAEFESRFGARCRFVDAPHGVRL